MDITSINNSDYFSSILQKQEKPGSQLPENSEIKSTQNIFDTKIVETTLELSEEEKAELRSLQARDREVRAHESAHLHTAGKYAASSVIFSYDRGPDNRIYVVGGEVRLDADKESTPEKTLEKMEIIKRAALAPLNPSSQDRIVAAKAASMALQASIELLQEKTKEQIQKNDQTSNNITYFERTIIDLASETYSKNSLPGDLFDIKI